MPDTAPQITFRTRDAHPAVIDLLAASLAGVELDAEGGFPAVLVVDAAEAKYASWTPRANPEQLADVERDRRISTYIKHDGWWRACIYDINDEPEHQVLARSRAEAVLRCAVLAQCGEVITVADDTWPDVAAAIQAEEFERMNGFARGAYSRDMLKGVVFPLTAYEIVEQHSGGQVQHRVAPIVVEGWADRTALRARDERGDAVRLQPQELCTSAEAAHAIIQQQGECETAGEVPRG